VPLVPLVELGALDGAADGATDGSLPLDGDDGDADGAAVGEEEGWPDGAAVLSPDVGLPVGPVTPEVGAEVGPVEEELLGASASAPGVVLTGSKLLQPALALISRLMELSLAPLEQAE
jgi:hypothetical protein